MERNTSKRLQNLLAGKYSNKLEVSVGYTSVELEHVDGDVWEENGKTWTMKDGIKQTVGKLAKARLLAKMPFTCPVCNHIMKTKLDKKAWTIRSTCFDCMIEEDTKRMFNGEFKQFEKTQVANNMKAQLDYVGEFFKDYMDGNNSKHYITEQGDIENWSNAHTNEELKEIFTKQIDRFKEQIDKHVGENNAS